jgi:uncharacterized protein (DUF488 family)
MRVQRTGKKAQNRGKPAWLSPDERWQDNWRQDCIGADKEIFTVGHSTHTADKFISMLRSFGVTMLADIRAFPSSRRHPQFNASDLMVNLGAANISYRHFPGLGGRRKPRPDSPNSAWRNESFRGYADYMETRDFEIHVAALEQLAAEQTLCYMCSEAVWWSCHRALLSDHLKSRGWKVTHIMDEGKSSDHPFTTPARVVNGKLTYHQEDLFTQG